MVKTPLVSVSCVIFRDNAVLLIRRAFEPYKNCLALPGGFVDIGESVEQACSRELKEETSLTINFDSLKLIGVYSNPNRDPLRHTVNISYLGQSNLENLKAGDDASSVELVENWRELDIAFDNKKIIEDAWTLYIKAIKKGYK
ncbi:NUDIX hydrolase [Arcobacter sp. LA11]|uniref:NUDIX domain-containing protein n=1 Tax=Arcobacter sp. LA11 TaxID=1898176 RepID=UPI0009326162|nr:NUDIX hydrolase [Arcobacter sp. LA11]